MNSDHEGNSFIDKAKLFERLKRNNFVKRLSGSSSGEMNIFTQIYDQLHETHADFDARLERENQQRKEFLRSRCISHNGQYRIDLDQSMGLFHFVESAKALAKELETPIELGVPLILGDDIPHQGFYIMPISLSDGPQTMDMCSDFHKAEERAYLDYLESPAGRRKMMIESTRPGEKKIDYSSIVAYLRELHGPS